MPEPYKFSLIANGGNKVKRSRCVKLHGARAFDMAWVSHIQYGQPRALVLFDIQKCSAVQCIIEKHRFAALPRQYWKSCWRYKNDIVGWIGVNGGRRHEPSGSNSHCRSAKTLRYLTACILIHRTFSLTVVIGRVPQQDFGTL